MPYFKLYPDIKYIKGKKRSSLYLLGHSKIIHLTESETLIFNKLLTMELKQLVIEYGNSIVNRVINFLVENGLGGLYDNNNYSESYVPTQQLPIRGYMENPINLDVLYIQISDQCQNNCDFCNNKKNFYTELCNSCIKWKITKNNSFLNYDILEKQIDMLKDINIKRIIFSGGDSFIHWNYLLNIIKKINNNANVEEIQIHCPGCYIEENKIKKLVNKRICIAFNFFTNNKNIDKMSNTIEILKKYNISFKINIMLISNTKEEYNKILEDLKLYLPRYITGTELINIDNKTNYKLVSLPTNLSRLEKINADRYFYNEEYSTCLNRKIAISADGNITLCPSWKKQIGSVFTGGIKSVLKNNSAEKYWKLTKNNIPICKDCENKYACDDCTCLGTEFKKEPKLLNAICDYRVDLGKWENDNSEEDKREDFCWKF